MRPASAVCKMAFSSFGLTPRSPSRHAYSTIQINRTEEKDDGKTPNTEMRTANSADDYDATVEALKGADAVIHLAAIPNPVGKADATVHNNNVCCAFIGMRAVSQSPGKSFHVVLV